jgi:hypothetical protein
MPAIVDIRDSTHRSHSSHPGNHGPPFSVIDLSAATTPTIEDALAEAGLMNKLASIRYRRE